MNYIFKHRLVEVTHPLTKVQSIVSMSEGQYINSKRVIFRNELKKLNKKERKAAIRALNAKGVKYHG